MKLKDILLKVDSEEIKADKTVRLAKNSAEKQIIELEFDLEEKKQRLGESIKQEFDLMYVVESEQDIAVMEDMLNRAREKIKELF